MFRSYDRDLIQKLKALDQQKSFPHEDVQLIQEKFNSKIPGLDKENRLLEDFDDYQSLINGSLSYVLAGRKIPEHQKLFLHQSFYSRFPIYKFLEEELAYFPDFKKELELYEMTREILIKF